MLEIKHKNTGEILHRLPLPTLQGADLSRVSLFSADLARADLRGANLQGASLIGARLRRARLQQANLRGATLYGADLWGASLREADLREADLRGADLEQANLSGALLAGVRLDEQTRLPRGFRPEEHGAAPPPRRRASAAPGSQAPGPPAVLIVDDDEGVRRTLACWLEAEGYRTATATTGDEALAYLNGHPAPALILLDLSMPGMDGWAFRIEQRKDPRLAAIPVVVCSAAYEPQPAANLVEANGYLAKPFDRGKVLGAVGEYCGAPREPVPVP